MRLKDGASNPDRPHFCPGHDLLKIGVAYPIVPDLEAAALLARRVELCATWPSSRGFGLELGHASWVHESQAGEEPDLARRYFLRPSSEPITFSYLSLAQESRFGVADYARMGEALTLHHLPLRGGREARFSLDGKLHLSITSTVPPATGIKTLVSLLRRDLHPTWDDCLYILAQAICFQPLQDSNSRTAMALVNLILMKAYRIQVPPLTFGPSLAVRPISMATALTELVTQNSWTALQRLFRIALQESISALGEREDLRGA